MNKKFLSAILFGALMVSSTGTFVSCKDYDDDIDNINKELSTLKGDLSALQAKVNEGKWITSLAPTTGGFTVTFSDNTSYTITNGKDGAAGADAVKWEIGTDGFWYKNDVKTEYQAVGQAGEAGVAGVSPYIGENGNWFAYNTETKEVEDTGISAAGTSTYVVKNGDNYELHVYNQTTGEYESIVLPATAAAAALNVVFMPTYSDMQTKVVAINIPVGDELNDKNHLWDNNVSLTNDIVFNYRVSPASIDLAKANIGFLVNEVQSRAAGSGAEVVYEVKVVYPEVTLVKDNDYWKDGYMINAGKLVGSNYVMSGDLRRGYKNKDLDLVFETVAGETRTDFDLTNNILTYTGSCNDKEGNRINISKIDPVDVMVFVLINGQKIDNGTKIQVKFADPLKNITLKKDAKFETTDKKNPADKLQLNSAINLVSIAGEKVIENGTMDATIAGYYNAQAAKFEVSEEDAAKGASVNATTGEFTWQNDGVALTANKTINVKVTVTYTWGVAVGTIPVTVKSNL